MTKKDKNNTNISIITVVFNDVENIEKTINSVKEQSYKNIEYIVIDGGSTDGTVEIIRKKQKNISYWISKTDNGIYDAMNKGIKNSSGELLYFLNSNDFLYDNKVIENVVKEYLKNNKPDIIYGRQYFIYNDPFKKDGIPPQISPDKRLPSGMTIYHQATFIHKRVFQRLGLFNTSYLVAADYDFFCRAYVSNCNFVCIDEIISKFTHGGRGYTSPFVYRENAKIVKKYFGIFAWVKYSLLKGYSRFLACLKRLFIFLGFKRLIKKLISINDRKKTRE